MRFRPELPLSFIHFGVGGRARARFFRICPSVGAFLERPAERERVCQKARASGDLVHREREIRVMGNELVPVTRWRVAAGMMLAPRVY